MVQRRVGRMDDGMILSSSRGGRWLLHPYGLHDLEDGGPDDHKDEEGDELRRDGVAVVLLGRLADVASFGDVLGIALIGLAHVRRGRHLGGEGGDGEDGVEEEKEARRDCLTLVDAAIELLK